MCAVGQIAGVGVGMDSGNVCVVCICTVHIVRVVRLS